MRIPFVKSFCLVEIFERKNPGLRGRGWKKCRQTEEKAREVTLKFCKILLKINMHEHFIW